MTRKASIMVEGGGRWEGLEKGKRRKDHDADRQRHAHTHLLPVQIFSPEARVPLRGHAGQTIKLSSPQESAKQRAPIFTCGSGFKPASALDETTLGFPLILAKKFTLTHHTNIS
jgi:hypothetical protein